MFAKLNLGVTTLINAGFNYRSFVSSGDVKKFAAWQRRCVSLLPRMVRPIFQDAKHLKGLERQLTCAALARGIHEKDKSFVDICTGGGASCLRVLHLHNNHTFMPIKL
jgi:hypothetical protein